MSRGMVLNHTTRMVTEDCINCGIIFAMPEDFWQRCQDDHSKRFYCPNGHNMVFTGKTAEQKAKERAAELERHLASREEDLRSVRMQRDAKERSLRATKAAATRARNRIEKGVCPHPECHRSFQNVKRHVERCHPDFAAAVEAPVPAIP